MTREEHRRLAEEHLDRVAKAWTPTAATKEIELAKVHALLALGVDDSD